MAMSFRERGDDPVIIEDPGGGMLGTVEFKGRLLIRSRIELDALLDGKFQSLSLAKVTKITVRQMSPDAQPQEFPNARSLVITNGEKYTSAVYAFSEHNLLNVDPPAKMNTFADGGYFVYYNEVIAYKINLVVVDGLRIPISHDYGVQIALSVEEA
jgi:hypothetical protein